MNRFRLPIAALLMACLLPLSAGWAQDSYFRPALTDKDIDRELGIHWYGVYLQDKKCGTCKIEVARSGDAVVETMVFSTKATVFGIKTESNMTQVLTFEAKAPHRLLKATIDKSEDRSVSRITATRRDRVFDYILSEAGKVRPRVEAEPPYGLADSLALSVWLRSERKVGDKIWGQDLDVEEWKPEPIRHTVKSVKTSLVGGVAVKFYEIEFFIHKLNLNTLARLDSNGQMLSFNIGIFELRKETEAQAKNTEYSQDLFVLGMAKIDRPIGNTTRLTELTLEIVGKEGDVLQSGPRQTVSVGNGKRYITLGKKYSHSVKADAKAISDNLKETNAYAIADSAVKVLVRKAVGDAATPEEKVKRIVAFVDRFITPAETGKLPNIHDLLEQKKGDCKSYALLTTILCRAAGVPSREVAGLLYMGDDAKAFGLHAWNEVVLSGVWVPVDASLGETEVNAGHISFGDDVQAAGVLLQSLGKLSFHVLGVQTSQLQATIIDPPPPPPPTPPPSIRR